MQATPSAPKHHMPWRAARQFTSQDLQYTDPERDSWDFEYETWNMRRGGGGFRWMRVRGGRVKAAGAMALLTIYQ